MLAPSDQLLEDIYDLVHCQPTETARVDTARSALLAGQFRAQQRKQQATQRAVERHAAERKALRASTRNSGLHTADPAGRLSPVRPGGDTQEGNL